MIIEFIGAAHEVTGSCHFIEVGTKHFLVDCGMEQGADIYEKQEIPVNPAIIDGVFITHAHIDHSGLLPLLYSHGFRGNVYATKATCELCDIMLRDSAHIQQQEAEWKNRKGRRAGNSEVTPLYDINDAIGVIKKFIPCDYDTVIEICDEVKIRFNDAGHLLGSSSIEVWLKEDEDERKIVFSGDIGNGGRPLIRDPHFIKDADYVLIESTYGDRLHDAPPDFAIALANIIEDTFKRGGNVVIPSFAVGRTQEILYFLRRIKAEKLCSNMDHNFEVYIDSPLAVEATEIFHENVSECFNDSAKEIVKAGKNPIKFPGLKMAVTSDESRLINMDMKPKVIISASGMCEAGRIRHHLKHNLWRPECTIAFVGYQVPGTLGAALLGGAKEVKLFGETVNVEAKIVKLPGISGHADREGLLRWIGAFEKPVKKVFVVHGDDVVTDNFAATITDKYGYSAVAPYSGDCYDLVTGALISEGLRIKKEKKVVGTGKTSPVFERLVAAAARLTAVVHKCKEMANKDLAKFADQINALCDKWDR